MLTDLDERLPEYDCRNAVQDGDEGEHCGVSARHLGASGTRQIWLMNSVFLKQVWDASLLGLYMGCTAA